MKKFGLIIGCAIYSWGAQATTPAVVSAATGAVHLAVVNVSDVVKNTISTGKGTAFSLYDRTRDTVKVVVTGQSAKTILAAAAKNSFGVAHDISKIPFNVSTDALVLTGNAVKFGVRLPFALLKGAPGTAFIVEPLAGTQSLVTKLVGIVTAAPTIAITTGGKVANETLNLLEAATTKVGGVLYMIGKQIYDLPGRLFALLGCPRYQAKYSK